MWGVLLVQPRSPAQDQQVPEARVGPLAPALEEAGLEALVPLGMGS